MVETKRSSLSIPLTSGWFGRGKVRYASVFLQEVMGIFKERVKTCN